MNCKSKISVGPNKADNLSDNIVIRFLCTFILTYISGTENNLRTPDTILVYQQVKNLCDLNTKYSKPEFIIDNPYEKVNWEDYGRYKADLHARTSRSDGHFSPHIIVDCFHDLGFSILAITDHGVVTYPWQEHNRLGFGDLDYTI